MVRVVVTVSSLFTGLWAAWRICTRPGPRINGALLIDAVDADGDSGAGVDGDGVVCTSVVDGVVLEEGNLRSYMAFAGIVARIVKVRMGVPKDSAANRIVAWELCGKELTVRNVRKCDMAKFQSLAHKLVFIPSKWDRLIEEALGSDEVIDRCNPPGGRRGFWSWLLRYKEGRKGRREAGGDK